MRQAIVTALLEAIRSDLGLIVPVTDTLVTMNLDAALLVRGLFRCRRPTR